MPILKAEMTEQDQQDLLETIHLEGERLDRYIQNLLDMTRLGHEGLTLKRDWIGVDRINWFGNPPFKAL